MKKYGIIDLGSNSVRMNIVEVSEDGAYNLLDQAKEMVRLSEGLHEGLLLKEIPMMRTINAVKLFQKLIEAYEVETVIAVATAAVRMAKNGDEFLNRVQSETGIAFKIISGHMEAYYDYLGVVNTIDLDNYVMIDIGGGSTEIALIQDRRLQESISLPFGSVILTEEFMDPFGRAEGLKKAESFIAKQLKSVTWIEKGKTLPIVGLGGVVRTVGKIHKNKVAFPAISLHNYQMSRKETQQVFKKLLQEDIQAVAQVPGVNKERADIMSAGILPLVNLMDILKSDLFIVSGNGLRDGLFFEQYFTDFHQPVILENVLSHSLENVMKRYSVFTSHSHHVTKISLKLFDGLKMLHDFTENERKILKVASMLHDIGMHIEYYNHHRHGFYLTINSRVYGLSNAETIMAAFLVGMHRDVKFKEDYNRFSSVVDKIQFERLKKLSLFLRIAEKLDRSESAVVKDLKINKKGNQVNIDLISDEDTELERLASGAFLKEFNDFYGCELIVHSR